MKPIKHLTLIYPYYNSQGMLSSHLLMWDIFPKEILRKMTVIIVDDGSQKPALDVVNLHYDGKIPFDLRLYRVLVDIPWNQHGARNLGAREAEDGWMLISDIDHTVPLKTVNYIFDHAELQQKRMFYTFGRLTAIQDGDSLRYDLMLNQHGRVKPHPNTYLLTKNLYWDAGGYDEDFCGTYGGDGPFRRLLDKAGTHNHLPDAYIIRWPREIIPDASQPPEFREAYRPLYGPRFKSKGGSQIARPTEWVRFPWERQL